MFSANSSQVSGDRLYVEDVFSTYLYTGNGSLRSITNGIDLATKGGMVWIKSRSSGSLAHVLYDTARGSSYQLVSNASSAEYYDSTGLNNFNSDGFQIWNLANVNSSGGSYASWTFREAANFFDVVTYTGTGANQNIAHNLGSVPGMILIKRTDTTSDWQVYHRSNANTQYMVLNTTAAVATGTTRWNSTTPTSSVFTVGTDATVNASGGTYVAYLFAHDTTSDGIIQCGSYTGTGSSPGPTINLGWEPQWVMIKNAGATGGWRMVDNMRGMTVGTGYDDKYIYANTTGAESSDRHLTPNATGFQIFGTDPSVNTNGISYIYIAIRRGPMRTPTSGTSVFAPILQQTGTLTTGFPIDTQFSRWTGGPYANNTTVNDRLRAFSSTTTANTTGALITSSTSAETIAINTLNWTNTTAGVPVQLDGTTGIYWNFRRAPSFFDVVCYTANNANQAIPHSLGVQPEMIIAKARNSSNEAWGVYHAALGTNQALLFDTSAAITSSNIWYAAGLSATTFGVSPGGWGYSTLNYVAYLFASCPGVSKVGSYTGNGSSQTINCGFAAGARFVLIKRTDSTGDWYVWDTARGIVSGNDPHLSLNTTAAEVTTDDSVDTDSSGFVVNQLSATNINVSSATYIYLAVA